MGLSATVPGNELNDARSWSLWATHDSASHWTRMATPPVTEAGVSMLLVDKLNASVLLAEVFVFDPPIRDHIAQRFVSRDSGATWQSRNFAMRTNVAEIATWNGASFGLIGDARPSHDGAESSAIPFARSDDGLRTWRAVDQAIVAAGQWSTRFWVNSRTGAILARTNPARLWETRNLGAHWTQLSEASAPYVQYIVQDAPASDLWRICGFISDCSSAPPILKCTQDSGKAWVDRADISISIPCPICARGKPGYAQGSAMLVGIASDGAVIVTDLGGLTSDYQTITALYRLESGATKWQSLGIIPNRSAHLYPFLAQGHTIWMVFRRLQRCLRRGLSMARNRTSGVDKNLSRRAYCWQQLHTLTYLSGRSRRQHQG
jgi:hypothetical protein